LDIIAFSKISDFPKIFGILKRTVFLSMRKIKKELAVRIGRYIDPLTDFGFKKIFGSEPNKDLLIAFLNEYSKVER
jgi:hypothetical protein